MNNELWIDPALENRKITSFIKDVLKTNAFTNVVIGMSAGIDSTACFYLLKEVVPPENIFIAHLYQFVSYYDDIKNIVEDARIPQENIYEMSIEPIVKSFQSLSYFNNEAIEQSNNDKLRLGNIMARVRMIILYDLAKKHNALVCGTENKTENLLGYFTRFGDQASDFEPIQHLYKTQVYALAKSLGIPQNIIDKEPTAGLWHGQTDEGEFGFTYKEADQVLFYYVDKKLKVEEIKKMGFKNAEKIINFSLKNAYKHHAPYIIG